MSVRTLKRLLTALGLNKSHATASAALIKQIIERKIDGPSMIRGYRSIPSSFFILTVQHFKFCLFKVQTDCGTENGILAVLRCALVESTDVHRHGRSPSNQQIEN